MKKKEVSNERLMFEIAQENKKLSEPLTRALKEVQPPLYTIPLYRPLHRPQGGTTAPVYYPLVPALTPPSRRYNRSLYRPLHRPRYRLLYIPDHIRQQPVSPSVAAWITSGCSLYHTRLQVEKLRHELANYQKDKMSLQNAKSRLHVLETQLRDLTWEHEARISTAP